MHVHTLKKLQHCHDFSANNEKGERRAQYVLLLTAVTMVVELVAGNAYGSMALLADGWHMSTHVVAFVIALFAYRYSRKHEKNPEYAFGTGKVNVLGGFASAVALAVVALLMAVESLERIINPETIHFNEAMIVAGIGLLINIMCAWLLKDDHSHSHHHDDAAHTQTDTHHHDHNLKAAYVHVLADALTSILAIGALFAGKYLGWGWLDAIMGIVGAIIITRWAYSLLKQAGPILLDASIEEEHQQRIKKIIESDSDNRISDMHIWRVGANHYAAIIALVTHYPKPAEHYKILLNNIKELSHVTIEVNRCDDAPCLSQ